MFFEACDLLIADLEDTFESQHISKVLSIKQALIQTANGDDFECEVAHLRESSYKHDINWSGLMLHLPMFQGIMKKNTFIMQLTSTSAVCDAMNTIIIMFNKCYLLCTNYSIILYKNNTHYIRMYVLGLTETFYLP